MKNTAAALLLTFFSIITQLSYAGEISTPAVELKEGIAFKTGEDKVIFVLYPPVSIRIAAIRVAILSRIPSLVI